MQARPHALRLTVGAKLIALIAVLLVLSLSTLVAVSTRLYTRDSTSLIQALNANTAGHLASDLQNNFAGVMEKMRTLGDVSLRDTKGFPEKARFLETLFAGDSDYLAFFLHERDPQLGLKRRSALVAPVLGDKNAEQTWKALARNPTFSLDEVLRGAAQVVPLTLADGTAAVALSIPLVKSTVDPRIFTHAATAVLKETRFTGAFWDNGVVGSYLVDRRGKLLAPALVGSLRAGDALQHKEIVKALISGKSNNEEKRYLDPVTHERMLGAFHTVGFGGLGVITEVPEAKAFASARRVQYDGMLVLLAVLSIAFLMGYFFSTTITWPIKQLVLIASRISQGDFDIDLKPRSRDEVADLSLAFNGMARGLKERDFVKATFNKFHNREVAEKILSGEVKLGGETREVTVFFSDIRSFTSLSEGMTPEAVVEMLNEYMTVMVAVIRKHGGVVDKYVGDAIMAVWGAPVTREGDVESAVRACLEMRLALQTLNEARARRGQPLLLIGMGLNSGSVVAGNIGSEQKLEYTVIGDTVNVASRVESMTKELGTDLLVSSSVYETVKDRFLFEPCQAVQVKGKSAALQLYKVMGYIDESGTTVLVQTPYSSYEASYSDKAA